MPQQPPPYLLTFMRRISRPKAARPVNVLAAGFKGAADVLFPPRAASIKNPWCGRLGAGVSIKAGCRCHQIWQKKGLEAEPAAITLRKFFHQALQTGPDETTEGSGLADRTREA